MTNDLFLKTVTVLLTYPPAAAAWRQVLPLSSGVSMSNPTRKKTFYMLYNVIDTLLTLQYLVKKCQEPHTPNLKQNYEL